MKDGLGLIFGTSPTNKEILSERPKTEFKSMIYLKPFPRDPIKKKLLPLSCLLQISTIILRN
jgi:hypothetical protein